MKGFFGWEPRNQERTWRKGKSLHLVDAEFWSFISDVLFATLRRPCYYTSEYDTTARLGILVSYNQLILLSTVIRGRAVVSDASSDMQSRLVPFYWMTLKVSLPKKNITEPKWGEQERNICVSAKKDNLYSYDYIEQSMLTRLKMCSM